MHKIVVIDKKTELGTNPQCGVLSIHNAVFLRQMEAIMRGRRKTVKISEAEWSIMKVLWDGCEKSDRGMTLGEIVQELSGTTDWSNTTIRTLIIRLSEKNAVTIDKTTGVYKYYPKSTKSECVKSEVESFVERVFDNSAYNLMASLVRSGTLTEKEKKDIIEILKEMD